MSATAHASVAQAKLVPVAPSTKEEFTSAINALFRDMVDWPWVERFPRALFIRDYEYLPERSPHDIDLLIDKAHHQSFLDHVAERADAFSLHCITWSSEAACFALVCDLDTANQGRAWAFLETRDAIAVTPEHSITAGDVDIIRDGPTGLPVPSRDWIAFLYLVQAARKGQPAKVSARLAAQGIAPGEAAGLVARFTGVKPIFGETLVESVDAQAMLRELLTAGRPAPARIGRHDSLRSRLSRYVSRHFYYMPVGRRNFYTIHGPDGVGKSTTCAEVERIFARLPLTFETFHHVTGWKYPAEDISDRSDGERIGPPEREVGFIHKILRAVYRSLPQSFQQAYVAATSYDKYLRQLNALLEPKLRDDRIILIDRYIYDLAIKNRLRGYGWEIIHRIFVRLARKPAIAFALTDRAERIHSRKQELSVRDIEIYMEMLEDVLGRSRTASRSLTVEGATPRQLARSIAGDILSHCGSRLMPLLRRTHGEGEGG